MTGTGEARTALREWCDVNLDRAKALELSKLVASYVASCVREDRGKQTATTQTFDFSEYFMRAMARGKR